MATDPYGNLTRDQRLLLNKVVNIAYESHDDVGVILERLDASREDKRAVSDALAGARR